jgi:hypothetical protein
MPFGARYGGSEDENESGFFERAQHKEGGVSARMEFKTRARGY